MNRAEFMNRLTALLTDVSPTEREEAIQYYKPALVNGMANFIRTFLPDAIPIIREPALDTTSLWPMPSSPSINNIMQIFY